MTSQPVGQVTSDTIVVVTMPSWVQAEETKPAPMPLLLVQAFVNTWVGDDDTDALRDPESKAKAEAAARQRAEASAGQKAEPERVAVATAAVLSTLGGDRRRHDERGTCHGGGARPRALV